MRLDNTSHPGRPAPDELVPSRYALRVGEIDVLVVSDGVLPLPTATMATNADPAVRAASSKSLWPPSQGRRPLVQYVLSRMTTTGLTAESGR